MNGANSNTNLNQNPDGFDGETFSQVFQGPSNNGNNSNGPNNGIANQ